MGECCVGLACALPVSVPREHLFLVRELSKCGAACLAVRSPGRRGGESGCSVRVWQRVHEGSSRGGPLAGHLACASGMDGWMDDTGPSGTLCFDATAKGRRYIYLYLSIYLSIYEHIYL